MNTTAGIWRKVSKEKAALSDSLYKRSTHFLLIVFLGLVVYSNTLDVPFVLDDEPNILENPAIRDFEFFRDFEKLEEAKIPDGIKNFFRSRYIGYLSFAINYKLHAFNIFGYHLFNLSIHIINAIFVYMLIVITSTTPFFSCNPEAAGRTKNYNIVAFIAGLIFVAHPIQTQAVTYTVQRFTSLTALFYLLAIILFAKARLSDADSSGSIFYVASLVSGLLAAKTKEIAFTLPVIIALYELMFFQGKIKERAFFLIPFFIIAAIIPLTMISTKGSIAEISSINESFNMANKEKIPMWSYFFTQMRVIITYIRLMFFPANQNFDYDYPVYHTPFTPPVLISFLGIIIIVFLGIYIYYRSNYGQRDSRLISFGIFWFFITLSVESTIIPIADVIFEHRLYLPSVGFIIAVTISILDIGNIFKINRNYSYRLRLATLILGIMILSIITYSRNTVWQDKITLWRDTVKKSPNKARPHNNLGISYHEKGHIEEAFREYQIALKLKPDYEGVHLNIGAIYFMQGRFEEAIKEYRTALKLKPGYARAHNNLGGVYVKLGRFDEAVKEYQTAIKLNPHYAKAYLGISNVYFKLGRIDEGNNAYKVALELLCRR